MDDHRARALVEEWSGGSGVVPRGPKVLLSVVPATPADVERHTGRRPLSSAGLWRLEVGGRFLASDATVYPGGVPFPDELHRQTAIIANEVWLYTDATGSVIGSYWWPDALRRPIASTPRSEYAPEEVAHPADAQRLVDVPVPRPSKVPWLPSVVACPSRDCAVVFCVPHEDPDVLNEMVVYEQGGVSVRASAARRPFDVRAFLRSHQPPFRETRVRGCRGVGRDPGRALGPQTWPWPAELRWDDAGVAYEIKGSLPLATLIEIAESFEA